MRVEVALCSGRHEIKTNDGKVLEDSIWIGPIDEPNDFQTHEEAFEGWLAQFLRHNEKIDLNIYVTGLTQLLSSVFAVVIDMDWAQRQMLSLTLWHFDRETSRYAPQVVLV